MQKYIDKFDYGNKDISDWDGKTDLDDDPRDLKRLLARNFFKDFTIRTSSNSK